MMSTLRVHRDLGSLVSLPLAGRGQGWGYLSGTMPVIAGANVTPP